MNVILALGAAIAKASPVHTNTVSWAKSQEATSFEVQLPCHSRLDRQRAWGLPEDPPPPQKPG